MLARSSTLELLKGFFAAILPTEGFKCAATLVGNGCNHRFFETTDELATFVLHQDAAGKTIYHACASFKTAENRKQENALCARSLWLDVDAGDGKPYPDAFAAAEAVANFCRSTGLPPPTYVGSGNGVHAYWPLAEALDPETWRARAQRLKNACEAHGLHADPSRAADIASILRSPGTYNRKNATPRLVQVGPLAGPYRPDEFLSRLPPGPLRGNVTALTESALVTHAPPPFTAAEVARLSSALACIPADSYDLWVRVGMALHRTGWGEPAFRIWNEWSRTAPEKYDEANQIKTWRSFDRPYHGTRITVAWIFHKAKEHGWIDGGAIEPQARATIAAHIWNDRTITADELRTMTFNPIRYVVPGFIPEGLTLLVGRPKVGKSWLALDLCLACAGDRTTLGAIKPVSGDVLYLALEDGNRRLQRRIDKLMSPFEREWPKRLQLVPSGGWRRADQGGLDDIQAWCKSVSNPVLVVIDTLERIRKPATGKTPLYSTDYEGIIGLQKVATDYGIAIIVLHHDRKSEADDAFDTVSGTLGLTGAADTILILKRRAGGVTLYARGRDIEDSETALQFDKATCHWTILGSAAEVQRSTERARVIEVLKTAGQSLSTKEIMIDAEMGNRNAVDILLGKMVRDNEIQRVGRARYSLPSTWKGNGQIGQKERFDNQATDTAREKDCSNLSDLSVNTNRHPVIRSSHRGRPVGPGGAAETIDAYVASRSLSTKP